jgi:hypothetical protein
MSFDHMGLKRLRNRNNIQTRRAELNLVSPSPPVLRKNFKLESGSLSFQQIFVMNDFRLISLNFT